MARAKYFSFCWARLLLKGLKAISTGVATRKVYSIRYVVLTSTLQRDPPPIPLQEGSHVTQGGGMLIPRELLQKLLQYNKTRQLKYS